MGQRAVHYKAGGHPAGVVLLRPAEQVDIAGLSHAQADQLDILVHDVRNHIVHQVQALLVAQPGDQGYDGHLGPDGQAQLLLKGALAGGFSRKVLRGIGGGDVRIGGGVIFLDVNAV